MTLVFDAKAHIYTFKGRALPSVTSILADVGFIDKKWFTSEDAIYARDRGTLVHQTCEYYDKETLIEEDLDPILKDYLVAYKKFREELPLDWLKIEQPMCDEILGYAGTPDRVGDNIVLDIKTGTPQGWHGVQLAAYVMLERFISPHLVKRYGLYLTSRGNYKLKKYSDKTDFDAFRSSLAVYNYKRR